jgi:hypothetical protein
MNYNAESNNGTTRQMLVNIYHPRFREGYQAGRQYYFQEQSILTDKELLECLQFVFEEEEGEEREANLYYSVGQLVGKMSGSVIPRHPHEDNTQELQETFLIRVLQEYGVTGQALINSIRQFWAMQDQLAQTLDADTFEQMLHRGIEKA